MKKTSLTINMAKKIASSINTRVSVEMLQNELAISDALELILDFSHIESVSRSAAHQLIMMQTNLVRLFEKKIIIKNMNDDLQKLFETLMNNRNAMKPKIRPISHERVHFEKLQSIIL